MKRTTQLLVLLGGMLMCGGALGETTIQVDGDANDWWSSDAQCALNESGDANTWVDVVRVCATDDYSTNGYFYLLIEFAHTGNEWLWLWFAGVYLDVDYDNDGVVDYTVDLVNDPEEQAWGIVSLPYLEMQIDYDLVDPEGNRDFSFSLRTSWVGNPQDSVPSDGSMIRYSIDPQTIGPRSVKMLSTRSVVYDAGVEVAWVTASELNNSGFHVERRHPSTGGYQRLTETLIPGLGNAPFGKTYRFRDEAGLEGDVYRIVDVEFDGTEYAHPSMSARDNRHFVHNRLPRLVSRMDRLFDVKSRMERFFSNISWGRARPRESDIGDAIAFHVEADGVHYLSSQMLAEEGLGAHGDDVRVWRDGVQVPVMRADGGIYFVGTSRLDRYADYAVYTVTPGGGEPRRVIQGRRVEPCAEPVRVLPYTAVIERNEAYYVASATSDPFVWVSAYQGTDASVTFDLDDVAKDTGNVRVALMGMVTGTDGPDHRVNMSVNGSPEALFEWNGRQEVEMTLWDVPLRETDNTVTISLLPSPVSDMVSLDRVEVDYARHLDVPADGLFFSAPPGTCVGLDSEGASVDIFDVTDADQPVRLRGSGLQPAANRGFRVPLRSGGSRGDTVLHVVYRDNAHLPVPAGRMRTTPLVETGAAIDYVLIFHPSFSDAAEIMAAYHRENGLRVTMFSVNDIFDVYGYGRPSPMAIRAFLKDGIQNWQAPPEFVLLMGGASVDSNDVLGVEQNDFVPTRFHRTSLHGYEAADDGWYVDGLGDIAIGRLPFQRASQAAVVVNKLVTHYTRFRERAGRSVFVADVGRDGDGGDDAFERAVAGQLAAAVGDTLGTVVEMRVRDGAGMGDLEQVLHSDVDMVSFHGHAYLSGWSSPQIANVEFVDRLSNERLFTVFSFSCFDGAFVGPWDESLAWKFVSSATGGAMAAYAGSSLSAPDAGERLSQLLTEELTMGALTLGEAVALAERRLSDEMGFRAADTRATFNLIGDPAAPVWVR